MQAVIETNDSRSKSMLSRAVAVSILLHAALGILFWIIQFKLEATPPEWIEISFSPAQELHAAPVSKGEPVPEQPAVPNPPSPQVETKELVDLPKRRMLEDDPDELRVPTKREHDPEERTAALPIPAREREGSEEPTALPAESEENATDRGLPEATENEQDAASTASDPGKQEQLPYAIEGEAADRLVLHRVIPRYPAGVQREATVKISFTVTPEGHLGTAIPLLKGNAELERAALQAFRQWRFNPLPSGSPQVVAHGVITFHFILR